jgi:starvation-inducible DNA-binding protein
MNSKGHQTREPTINPFTNPELAVGHDISSDLNALLADMFALYMKTKNFHWHVSGPHFRDFHLLLDDQAGQIFATTDVIAERVRKHGGSTLWAARGRHGQAR